MTKDPNEAPKDSMILYQKEVAQLHSHFPQHGLRDLQPMRLPTPNIRLDPKLFEHCRGIGLEVISTAIQKCTCTTANLLVICCFGAAYCAVVTRKAPIDCLSRHQAVDVANAHHFPSGLVRLGAG